MQRIWVRQIRNRGSVTNSASSGANISARVEWSLQVSIVLPVHPTISPDSLRATWLASSVESRLGNLLTPPVVNMHELSTLLPQQPLREWQHASKVQPPLSASQTRFTLVEESAVILCALLAALSKCGLDPWMLLRLLFNPLGPSVTIRISSLIPSPSTLPTAFWHSISIKPFRPVDPNYSSSEGRTRAPLTWTQNISQRLSCLDLKRGLFGRNRRRIRAEDAAR